MKAFEEIRIAETQDGAIRASKGVIGNASPGHRGSTVNAKRDSAAGNRSGSPMSDAMTGRGVRSVLANVVAKVEQASVNVRNRLDEDSSVIVVLRGRREARDSNANGEAGMVGRRASVLLSGVARDRPARAKVSTVSVAVPRKRAGRGRPMADPVGGRADSRDRRTDVGAGRRAEPVAAVVRADAGAVRARYAAARLEDILGQRKGAKGTRETRETTGRIREGARTATRVETRAGVRTGDRTGVLGPADDLVQVAADAAGNHARDSDGTV